MKNKNLELFFKKHIKKKNKVTPERLTSNGLHGQREWNKILKLKSDSLMCGKELVAKLKKEFGDPT